MATKSVATGKTVVHTKPLEITTAQTWAIALISALNKQLAAKKQPQIAYSENNITNIVRWIHGESAAGNWLGNNPLNLNTWGSPHPSLAGGSIKYEYGIYVQTFPTLAKGATLTASNLLSQQTSIVRALQKNATPGGFGTALSHSGWYAAGYANSSAFPTLSSQNYEIKSGANAASLTQTQIDQLSKTTVVGPSGPGNLGPAGPLAPVSEQKVLSEIEALIRSGKFKSGYWPVALQQAFDNLTSKQKQQVLTAAENYAQTYNNPDTTIGADIGRGFDKTANAVKSALSPFTRILGDLTSTKTWIIVGAVILILVGVFVLFHSQITGTAKTAARAA